jgi:DNA-binding response OmpR family regulator
VKKILIVEDQIDVLNLLKMVLRNKDRKILLSESGEKALEIARETIPDVVLLDIMLPGGINGYEVARILKNDPKTANCAIIVTTARVQEQDKIEALEAGADDFIGKPYNLEELKNKIMKFIA